MAQDIVNLNRFQIYLRLMIDSVGSQPFSAGTLPPLEKPANRNVEAVIEASRRQFARPREEVEKQIMDLIGLGRDGDAPQKAKDLNEQKKKDKKRQKEFDNYISFKWK